MPTSKTLWDVMVPMRDGVHLAANVLFPEGEGPFPVILNRTPYIKDTAARVKRAQAFLNAGYVVVHMDVRGRGNSEGVFNPYFQEIEDGYDSLEWCGVQPWSTGKVGTFGGSYEGWTQIYPTRLQSPHHRAAFLMCTPSMHPFHEGMYWSGVPMPIMGMWTLMVSGKTNKEQIAALDWEAVVNVRPLRDLMTRLGLSGSFRDVHFEHDTLDAFYQRLWYDGVMEKTIVPCYHVTGWFDDDQRGTLDLFPALAMTHPDPKIRRQQKLLVGPWPHRLSSDTSKLGDFDYGPSSMVPLDKEAIRWFDYWLKGIDTGIMREPPVKLFVMGENRWADENEWPIARTKWTKFFLHSKGRANSLYGDGKLSTAEPAKEPVDAYTYDPAQPTPFVTEPSFAQIGGPDDYRSVERRDDVLVYTSEPVTEDTQVCGPIRARLYAASSARDTDFMAMLIDVWPNGYAERLIDGMVRARFRDGMEKPSLIEPGRIYAYNIDAWNTCQTFLKGHRIRVQIASSAFPKYDRNPNTGEPLGKTTRLQIADQKIYHDAEHPSHIVLPLVPKR